MSVKAATFSAVGKVSLFGWLENLPLYYPIKGALLRGLKAGLAAVVAALLAAATQGTLFPDEWTPAVILILTMLLQAADKYIREWNIDAANATVPISDTIPDEGPVNTDATVPVEPPVDETPPAPVTPDPAPVVDDTTVTVPDDTVSDDATLDNLADDSTDLPNG